MRWKYWAGAVTIILGLTVGIVFALTPNTPGPQRAHAQEPVHPAAFDDDSSSPSPPVTSVDVVHPQKGLDYEIEQPGTVHSFEVVQLQAKASGFLEKQTVDIGDKVKKGQVLAVIAVPELAKQLKHNKAAVARAKANVEQMDARVVSAEAAHEAAKAGVTQADAAYRSAQAWVRYYTLAYNRKKALFESSSIEEKLLDEAREKKEASIETEQSCKAAIATAHANLSAMAAKIVQAKADVKGSKADVDVAQAEMEKTQVLLDYTVIRAPFDGAISHRAFFPSDYICSAANGATQPLLTVQRLDKLRVVVRLPDSVVPYLDKGDPALVRIDSLPGKKFVGRVSRIAGSEDPSTRLMRTEIDLPNPTGEISDGMYGKVTIVLDRFPNLLSIPSTSVMRAANGKATVYVVKDGRLEWRDVELGKDNGQRSAVTKGLAADDLVVRNPAPGLSAGTDVQTRLIDERSALDDDL